MKYQIIVFSYLMAIMGCNSLDSERLVGKWQAYFISEGGETLNLDYTPVNFEFTNDGYYSFNSTVDYKEAGTYYINGTLLFTLDTVNTASSEKAVQIEALTSDSLILKMMANGKDKLMKLKKVE